MSQKTNITFTDDELYVINRVFAFILEMTEPELWREKLQKYVVDLQLNLEVEDIDCIKSIIEKQDDIFTEKELSCIERIFSYVLLETDFDTHWNDDMDTYDVDLVFSLSKEDVRTMKAVVKKTAHVVE